MNENKKLDIETAELLYKGILGLREMMLKSKKHIKKYYKCRKLHSDILDSMIDYIYSGKYNFNEEMNKINDSLLKETKGNLKSIEVDFDMNDDVDARTFFELAIYKNHENLNCVLDEYLSKNKFRNKEKIDFLYAMKESFVSFFKVISTDYDGYVELEDLFTGKKYTIIDISLSTPGNKLNSYIYSRLISYDGICFLSGVLFFPKNISTVNKYIKNCKIRKKSALVRTIELYHLYRKYGVKVKVNNIS